VNVSRVIATFQYHFVIAVWRAKVTNQAFGNGDNANAKEQAAMSQQR